MRRLQLAGTHLVAVAMAASLLTGCAEWDIPEVTEQIPVQDQTSIVYAADGSTVATLHAVENREVIALTEVAKVAADAIVAIEDPSFWDHTGVDYAAIVRAMYRNVEAGEPGQGGSTITQQYVKNVLVGNERTLDRKMREASLAMQIEKTFPKERILELYVNTVYFGRGAYGIEAAARLYFKKNAAELTLGEAALLAGMIQSPATYDPYQNLDATLRRRERVFDHLIKFFGYPKAEIDAAREAGVIIAPISELDRFDAPYFIDYIRQWILDDPLFGDTPGKRADTLYAGGLRIETTLDPRIQRAAESAISKVIVRESDPYAAVVVIDPRSGAIRAMVGGRDYFSDTDPKAKFNLAYQAKRQPGSAFKPFALVTALANGISEDKIYKGGSQISIPLGGGEVWEVKNFDNRGYGPMSLRTGTTFSVNVVYAQLMRELGPSRVVATARKMGITSEIKAVYAVGLGSEEVSPLEMAGAYQTLANNGEHIPPYAVTKITRANGEVLFEANPEPRKAIDPRVAAKTNDILQDVMKQGTAVDARIGRPAAGKTGTSEHQADAWFIGYTPDIVASVWVGFPQGAVPMEPPNTREPILGGTWPAQIWQQLMVEALVDTPASQFPPPDGGEIPIDADPVPDFVGQRQADAQSWANALGYQLVVKQEYSPEVPPDRIIRQDPAPGTVLPLRGSITIWVSTLEGRPVPVPNLLGLTARDADDALELARMKGKRRVEAEPVESDALRRAGRVWKQQPAADSMAPPGTTVEYWVNPAAPAGE